MQALGIAGDRRAVAVIRPNYDKSLLRLPEATYSQSSNPGSIPGDSRIGLLASAIFAAVIRRASPAARQWGTAMQREMDFIESDWAALFWALGSAG